MVIVCTNPGKSIAEYRQKQARLFGSIIHGSKRIDNASTPPGNSTGTIDC